eukprot:gene14699-5796_t
MFAGGCVFMNLEAEQAKKALSPNKELRCLKNKIAKQTNLSENYINMLFRRLEKAIKENGVKEPYKWNYYESCFFVGSLLTTIGYGHIAPKTTGGRMFTIFFCLFGIPLTAIVVRNLSKKITNLVLKIVHLLVKAKRRLKELCSKQKRQKTQPQCREEDGEMSERKSKNMNNQFSLPDKEVRIACIIMLLILVVIFLLQSALFRVISEGWTMQESIYFWFVTLTTIGLGDYVPYDGRRPSSLAATVVYYTGTFYLLLGLALIASLIQSVSFVMEGRLPAIASSEPQAADDSKCMNETEQTIIGATKEDSTGKSPRAKTEINLKDAEISQL